MSPRNINTIITIQLTGQTEFTIPFEYLTRRFVQVTLVAEGKRQLLTLGSDYRFISSTKISLFVNPPAEYVSIELRRVTSAIDQLVSFRDGSILRANDLNVAQVQTLHIAEEARDNVSESFGLTASGDLDTRRRRILNLAEGVNPTDAVNLAQTQRIAEQGGSFTLREDLRAPNGVQLIPSAASKADIAQVNGALINVQSTDVVSELASRGSIFNRQTFESTRVSAPTSAPANAGYSQGLFVKHSERTMWVTFDPDANTTTTGTKYIGKYDMRTGALISECTITDSRVGHLDNLYVSGDGVGYTAGNPGSPTIIKLDLSTGAVIGTINLSMTPTSQALLAVDSSQPDKFIVWARFGGDKVIVSGRFSEESGGVVPVTQSPLKYPQSEILQGIAALGDRVYFLMGAGGAGLKSLGQYRISTGEEQATVRLQPDVLFADALGGTYEPEGLCVTSDREGSAASVNIYMGWVFGGGTKDTGTTVVFNYSDNTSRHVPSVDGYAGRAGASSDYQIKDLHIRLRYNGTIWEIEQGDFLSALTHNTIKNLAVSTDKLNITFDLVKSYQDILSWSCEGDGLLPRFGRVVPAWMHKAGGSASAKGHSIRFIGMDRSTYAEVVGGTIQTGTRMCLKLTVIQ